MGSRRVATSPALLLALVVVGACASFEPALIIGPDEGDWSTFLRGKSLAPDAFPHPLATTPAMVKAAERLAGGGRPRDRLDRLQKALFDPGRFPFRYESTGTLTASEAFERREGNCLSFTNLFIALARSQGLDVRAAFPVHLGRSEKEGDLIVVNTHVVAAYRHGGGTDVFDFDRSREGPVQPVKLVDDAWLAALYLNNRGVEELRRESSEEARRYLDGAVRIRPDFAGAWGNLGVNRRRAGDLEGALEAYRRALEVDPGHPTVLTNLSGLYRRMGREREARIASEAADPLRASSHVLLVLGDLARGEGRVEEAERLYRRARRTARREPDPLVSLARLDLESGRREPARRALRRALKLDPEHEEARRLLETIDATGGRRDSP